MTYKNLTDTEVNTLLKVAKASTLALDVIPIFMFYCDALKASADSHILASLLTEVNQVVLYNQANKWHIYVLPAAELPISKLEAYVEALFQTCTT